MKNSAKILLKTIGILSGGAIAGIILLALVFALPVNENTKASSLEIIEKEGWYPAIPIVSASLDDYFHSYLPGVLDGGTDTIMLETALDAKEQNVWKAAMDMNGYDYYWHGYVSVLRPLLMLFDYGEIRVLNGMLQLLLVVLLFVQIYRRKGMHYGILVLTSYFLLMPLAMPFSLQYSWVFYIAVGGALWLAAREPKGIWDSQSLYLIFMILGMLTSFFDLLTYPLYTWGFPLFWLLVLTKADKEPLAYVKKVVCTGLWWILGYAGLWVLKWGLGSLVLGRNIFESALYEVGFRLGTEDVGSFSLTQRLEVLYSNWKHYEYKIYVLVLAIWLVYFVFASLKKGIGTNAKNPAYALLGSSSIVWYLALANHTGGHHFFTYRIYGIAILAVLAVLVGATDSETDAVPERRIRLLAMFGICGILACGLSLLAREDISVTNGDKGYRELELASGEVCEMRFTPAFPAIKEIGVCALTEATEGVCIIRVADDGSVLYEEEIPLADYEGMTYADIPVDWKLDKAKAYGMQVSFEGADAKTSLLISENMENPMAEYGEVSVSGSSKGGQLLSGMTYSYRPLSKFTLAFLAMTWWGILTAGYIVLRKTRY